MGDPDVWTCFLCHLRASKLRKVHGHKGQDNFTPRWSLHTWRTDSHIGGGRSFEAPLNPAMINPLSGLHVNMKGYHVSRDGNLQGLRNGQRGSCAGEPPSATDPRGSGSALSDSWGWLGHSGSDSLSMSLSRGWGHWQG